MMVLSRPVAAKVSCKTKDKGLDQCGLPSLVLPGSAGGVGGQ